MGDIVIQSQQSQYQVTQSQNRASGRAGSKEEKQVSREEDGVSISISQDGLDQSYQDKQTSEQQPYDNSALLESYAEQAQAAKDSGKEYENIGKIMEIARRIANGDHVPATDEKKLIEYNAKLYQAAKAAAIVNANKRHKDYKSLFEDEENEDLESKIRALDSEADAATGEAVSTEEVAVSAETDPVE